MRPLKKSCLELTDLSTKHSVDFRGGGGVSGNTRLVRGCPYQTCDNCFILIDLFSIQFIYFEVLLMQVVNIS